MASTLSAVLFTPVLANPESGKRHHDGAEPSFLVNVVKELRKAIDLVIVSTVREQKQLLAEIIEPGRLSGQKHVTSFYLRGLRNQDELACRPLA